MEMLMMCAQYWGLTKVTSHVIFAALKESPHRKLNKMKTTIQKLFVLVILLVAISIRTFSQAPSIGWQKSFGGGYVDEANCIQQTYDGGYIVAGSTASYQNDGNLNAKYNNSRFDYGIVKLDTSGNIKWTSSLGGTSHEYAYSIQQTIDSGYIVAGYSPSIDGDVTGNHGADDFWIVKINSNGGITWQKSLGGSAGDFARSVQQTADKGYIVAGYTYSNNGDVSGYHGNPDYWVVKLDSAGNKMWTKTLGGSTDEYALSVCKASGGGYIIAGYTGSNDGDVTGYHGNYDCWLVKLSSSGTKVWAKTFGGSSTDVAKYIQQTADGGYLMSGYSYSNDIDVSGNHGSYDAWVVKLDSSGAKVWQKSLGGSADDEARSSFQTTDGGYIIAGHSNSTNGDVSHNHGDRDYWIVRLNASGDTIWTKSLGGSYFDLANSIQQTSDCGYIIAGLSASCNFDISNPWCINSGSNYWVVKLKTDSTLFQTFYADNDGDTYGDAGSPTSSCCAPMGYVSNSSDCNDGNAAIHPNAIEICNGGVDDDCDGLDDDADPGVTGQGIYYADNDGDGYGTGSAIVSCSQPINTSTNDDDCNDGNSFINPSVIEICNAGVDDDCDGLSDDADASVTGQGIYYADNDGDGYGTGAAVLSCIQPANTSTNDDDCNDGNASINPAAAEVCNGGVDDDCDGSADDADPGVTGRGTYYADNDGDGYGVGSLILACIQPANTSTNDEDCNDGNSFINGSATEMCNGGIDDDCDGLADDTDPGVTGQATYYADNDGDGYGAGSLILACVQPANTSTNDDDCNDGNTASHPNATEVCNGGVDDDCDGLADDSDPSVVGQGTYYADNDGDGYGAGSLILACVQPANASTNNSDCNDGNASTNPTAVEVCNGGVDDDCDGLADDADPGVVGQGTYYTDNDGDGYGAGSLILACVQPANTSTNDDDCNDGNTASHPSATEVCNGGVDDDCDGLADDTDPGVTGQGTYYADNDGDGYGAGSLILACIQPANTSTNNDDCNDGNASINPSATEVCNGGLDDDCDGLADDTDPGVTGQGTYYADNDGDGYGAGSLILACIQPANTSTNDDDCNDGNPFINPSVTEICNGGVDDDCDGLADDTDPGVTGQATYYADNDGDGYGAGSLILACVQPANASTNHDDCDDANATVNPTATETCNNTDDDCDATVDEGFDLDGDTYSTCHGDCNDGNPTIHPGAAEVLNGLDDNCNGQTDEGSCSLSVSAGIDENTYFGYTPDQCITKAAIVTGGTAPFVYSWTVDRPLQYDVITSSGDESILGYNSNHVTVCLLDTAVLCITITDANGCIATDCVNIYAEDVRCFAGNSGNNKVKVCHGKKTICVEENTVAVHNAHGDYLGKCTSAKEKDESLSTSKLQLYPNPTNQKFTVVLEVSGEERAGILQVFDMIGRIVYEEKISAMQDKFQQEIELSDAAAGMYLVKVILSDEVYARQLVISK
jgi:hypothetical protein